MRWFAWFLIAGAATACGDNHTAGGTVDAAPPGPPDAAERVDVADGSVQTCAPVRGDRIAFEPVAALTASGDEEPLIVTAPPGDPRLFVVMRGGLVRIVENGRVLDRPFVDLRSRAEGDGLVDKVGGERGLLGLAFHPDYARNGRFFVYYTSGPPLDGQAVIAELRVRADDPDQADPTTLVRAIVMQHHNGYHNAGMLEIGPDGMLWASTGEAGVSSNALDTTSPLGKLLRLDMTHVPTGRRYGIPADNPFARSGNGPSDPRPEIWAKGLRNPWRFSFDAATGDLFLADVGETIMEEIDVVASTRPGLNFGWNRFEGVVPPGGDRQGLIFPVVTHTQPSNALPDDDDGDWHAIIGGVVYRGGCFPDLQGWYYYSDYVDSHLWRFRWNGKVAVDDARVDAEGFPKNPTSIHTDAFGEVYVTAADGRVLRMVARP